MFVTTAITGCKCRKEASDSSASTTMKSPPPSRACEPAAVRRPPITKVGSSPPSASTLATRLVVVVLPCVPAIAMPCFSRISSASMTARGTIGILRLRAASTSGLSPCTAVEVTTASAPMMCDGALQQVVALEGVQEPRELLRRDVALLHEPAAAGVDQELRVAGLVVVHGVRERDEQRGRAHRGELGDGAGPGAADHEVGLGEC